MRPFRLLNYTTDVPAEKSILDIERLLARAGVKTIHKSYDGAGDPVGFVFSIDTKRGELFFKMPCDAERVFATLYAEFKKPHRDTKKRVHEQAVRIAWRIMLDSLAADLTRLKLQQVTPEQVFLPYLYNPRTDQTLYEQLEVNNFKMLLTAGKGGEK